MDTYKKLKVTSLIAVVALVLAACHKEKNVAPEPDKEFQSSVDISYAVQVISDIEMACNFAAENDLFPKFYMPAPGSTGTTVVTRNDDYVFITFNKTKCLDGRVRNGSIVMNITNPNPNAIYGHSYAFRGGVSLTNYQIDGWQVELKNTFYITNTLPAPVFDPKTTKITWSLNGDFVLRHLSDESKNMHCNVNLTKTLANTADPAVFLPTRQIATNWSLAVVEYKGSIFGETSGNVPFTYAIGEKTPLVRDFTCYPEKIVGVTTKPNVTALVEEFHPFVKGLAVLNTGGLYPRTIAYGNEEGSYGDLANDPKMLGQQCDNKGVITIKGISYPIDFKKEYQ